MLTTPNARIGDVLRQCGMVTEQQLEEAHALSRREGMRIGEALVAMGVLDRDRLAWALGVQFDLAYVDLDPDAIDWAFVLRFPLERLRELRLLPMSYAGGVVHAVIADPKRADLAAVVEELFAGRELVVQLADEERILALLGEAKRRQQTPNDAFAPPPRVEDAAAWLDSCIDMLARPDGDHGALVLAQDPRHPHLFRIPVPVVDPAPSPVPAALVATLLGQLRERFVEDLPVAGGFAGMCPAVLGGGGVAERSAVRATSLHGTLGRVVVFERIPGAVAAHREGASYRVRTSDVARAKAALAAICGASFEAHVDAAARTAMRQFAFALPELRAALCRRTAPAFAPAWVLWEAASAAEADLAPAGAVPRLAVVQHDAGARGTTVEPLGNAPAAGADELRAALAEVVRA